MAKKATTPSTTPKLHAQVEVQYGAGPVRYESKTVLADVVHVTLAPEVGPHLYADTQRVSVYPDRIVVNTHQSRVTLPLGK